MQPWTQILPFFVVAWLARRMGGRYRIPGSAQLFVEPYPGILISKFKEPDHAKS